MIGNTRKLDFDLFMTLYCSAICVIYENLCLYEAIIERNFIQIFKLCNLDSSLLYYGIRKEPIKVQM